VSYSIDLFYLCYQLIYILVILLLTMIPIHQLNLLQEFSIHLLFKYFFNTHARMELALTLHIVTKMKIVHQLHFLQQLIRIHICYLFYYSKIFKYLIIVYLGSVFISSDATATTLVPFLQSIKKLVEKAT